MNVHLLYRPVLVCPNCDHRTPAPPFNPDVDTAFEAQYHQCKGLKGIIAPLVFEGESAKTEKFEWGDYEGRELVQRDGDGRPMSGVHMTCDRTEVHIALPSTARCRAGVDYE